MLTQFHTKRDFEERDVTVAVLPVGALEQHGSHLPVGTDTLIAGELARRVAERLDAYLLPPLAVASSVEHRLGRGTVYLKAETLALVIRDIAESLDASGFRKLVVINGHGGNWILKPTVRRLNRELPHLQVVLVPDSVMVHRLPEVMKHAVHRDIHAGEYETSVLLHLWPEHVGEIRDQEDPADIQQSFMDYFDMTELTEDGYWGYPADATAEKGRLMTELVVASCLDYVDAVERQTEAVNRNKNKR